jgi:predicted DNA-binding ribbon-helix-helix protein
MCGVIKAQDPKQYRVVTRPLRLHGHVTSLRLEAAYWQILEELAEKERMSVSRLAAALYDEMCEHGGEVTNFASCLRVTCLQYALRKNARSGHAEPTPTIYRLDFRYQQAPPADNVTTQYYQCAPALE